MPVEMDPEILSTYSFRHQPLNNLLYRSLPVRSRFRRAVRTVKPPSAPGFSNPVTIEPGFDASAEHFRAERWAFVDPFFDAAAHRALVEGWPSRAYFNPMANILKSYDFGFKWLRGGGEPEFLDQFPALAATYAALRSDEFGQRVTDYWGDGVHRTAYSITASWATGGSSLIPHRDQVAHETLAAGFMNFVIFVDGTGGTNAGGTCIHTDNRFENKVFEPTQLTNSAILYDSAADFYHGFPPMRRGSFRWTINAQFAASDFAADAPTDV